MEGLMGILGIDIILNPIARDVFSDGLGILKE